MAEQKTTTESTTDVEPDASADGIATALDTVDWRRRTFAMYAAVRAEPDPSAAHALWRRTRDELFATHPASPLLPADRGAFTGLSVAPYDPAWRFTLEILPTDAEPWSAETGTDGTVSYQPLGQVEVPGVGALEVWRHSGYGGGLFLPIKDGLAGRPDGTYGGGRYLLDTIKGSDLGFDPTVGTLVVDFNFAYNPSCAYDPAWACPLAPRGDTVSAEIPVGERYPG